MDPVIVAVIGIAGMLALIALHVPIGIAMATAGFFGVWLLLDLEPAIKMFATAPTSWISSSLTLLRVLVKTRRGTWERSGFSRRRRQKSRPSEPSMSKLATTTSGAAFSAISSASSACSAIWTSTPLSL